jgi:hypothetical protein
MHSFHLLNVLYGAFKEIIVYTYTKLLNDMKLHLGLGLFQLMAINGFAQTLVASAGTTINMNDYEFTYTLGEVSTLTLNDNAFYVMQGYCQPEDVISGTTSLLKPVIRVVPNPLISGILEVQMDHPELYTITINDFLGRQVFQGPLNSPFIDLTRMVVGTYVATLFYQKW